MADRNVPQQNIRCFHFHFPEEFEGMNMLTFAQYLLQLLPNSAFLPAAKPCVRFCQLKSVGKIKAPVLETTSSFTILLQDVIVLSAKNKVKYMFFNFLLNNFIEASLESVLLSWAGFYMAEESLEDGWSLNGLPASFEASYVVAYYF